ncbi:MAG TPA: Rne/Rng family ribonuclease [Deltaproteobacteria bacterium]|nr:Rne/Rng family ribonuclease [Deltaproteobacteria bacterium]HQB38553.1 Rne/Rng family ribonuclease [Deltaproteobacteria bacterium]
MDKKISKKMLINVMHPEEARVAIVHDGRMMELNIEITGKEQTKGNIYKGVVLRVEPGLQAAFVDIGRAKPGFLQMGELHPDFWQWREDVPEDQRKRRPRIQEVLRRGQELLVQVEKDERDNKGSALTTYISLPGRYMVIMPGSDSTGISRKVEQEGERKKLKEIVAGMNIPTGIGYIIRTEAVGRTPEELNRDCANLLDVYNGIKTQAAEIKGAGEIYRDSGLIIRFIRDYFSDDIDEVLVDSKEAYREAKEFFRDNMPKCEKLVKLHKEKRPIFSRFQLEEQIDQIYEKRVPLPSGGSLIIEPTEALVSIDVNSGKSSGEKGIEDTAFRTNIEAAEEVARQLRLRDLGGLIVIDFIDMRERKHNHEVEKTLKQALKMDKARVNLGRISEFGLMEMSRQRIAKTLNDAIHLSCPHCEGRGKVKSVEAMAVSFLRKVHGAAAKGNISQVHGGLPLEVAYYLLNRKKRELTQIENDYDIEVTVKGKTSFLLNQVELETVKREKLTADEDIRQYTEPAEPVTQTRQETSDTASGGETTAAEGSKKRKRRRKKKKVGATTADASQETITETDGQDQSGVDAPQVTEEADGVVSDETTPTDGSDLAEGAPKPKKRKRRRSSRKTPTAEAETAPTEPAPQSETLPDAITVDTTTQPETAPQEEPAPPKRPRARRSTAAKKAAADDTAAVPPSVAQPPAKPVKPRRGPTKKVADDTQQAEAGDQATPKKARRPRAKKGASDQAVTAESHETTTPPQDSSH